MKNHMYDPLGTQTAPDAAARPAHMVLPLQTRMSMSVETVG
jgi:hypothetical protein